MILLTGSVGRDGANEPDDIKAIQKLLDRHAPATAAGGGRLVGNVAGVQADRVAYAQAVAAFYGPDIRISSGKRNADDQARVMDRMVLRLQAMSEGLRHAAACPAPRHAECPSFQRLLQAAAGVLDRTSGAPLRRPARR